MMEKNERLALLKQVAECAPEYMVAEYQCPSPGVLSLTPCGTVTYYDRSELATVRFRAEFYEEYPYLGLHTDVGDASAIIAMLDAMEKAGYSPSMAHAFHCSTGDSIYRLHVMSYHNGEPVFLEYPNHYKTRAEAVCRAFVAVFSGVDCS